MEKLTFRHMTAKTAGGTKREAIVGVVASGNLEVLVERVLPERDCEIDVATAAHGFGAVWSAVIADFVERYSPGGFACRLTMAARVRTRSRCGSRRG